MLLSDRDIRGEIKFRRLKITPLPSPSQFGGASIDLRLSSEFWFFKKSYIGKKVDLKKVSFTRATEKRVQNSITLPPGGMCLGRTIEKITLPNDLMGFLEGRSRFARMGLAVHVTSALHQPGSSNHIVLEIVNMAPFSVTLHKGMCISQIVFERLESPTTKPYKKYGKIAKRQ